MHCYSSKELEASKYALPDVEYWEETLYTVVCDKCHSEMNLPECIYENGVCPQCRHRGMSVISVGDKVWWWWWCFPGCLPESDVFGPYDTVDDVMKAVEEWSCQT
jgi:hypothetical protein